jgi:hypothetical protein
MLTWLLLQWHMSAVLLRRWICQVGRVGHQGCLLFSRQALWVAVQKVVNCSGSWLTYLQ